MCRLHEHRVAIEVTQKTAVTFNFTFKPADLITQDFEFNYLDAVPHTEVAVEQLGRRDGYIMSGCCEALGKLAHHFLNAATAGMVKLAAEKQLEWPSDKGGCASLRRERASIIHGITSTTNAELLGGSRPAAVGDDRPL